MGSGGVGGGGFWLNGCICISWGITGRESWGGDT